MSQDLRCFIVGAFILTAVIILWLLFTELRRQNQKRLRYYRQTKEYRVAYEYGLEDAERVRGGAKPLGCPSMATAAGRLGYAEGYQDGLSTEF